MFIQGVGTATPPHAYTQKECWEALAKSEALPRLSGRAQSVLKKVLTAENGIQQRHFAMENLDEAFAINPDTLHERFARAAPQIGTDAARKALTNAKVSADQIDALLVCTCTGYVCPGLTSYLSELLGLRNGVLMYDLVGQGCGAALPMLNLAEALLKSGQCKRVLAVAVEICSAAFYLDNDVGVLVSACLFGDGAGAVVLGNEAGPGRVVEWKAFSTTLNTRDRDLLKFESRGGMLRNVLDKSVPLLVVEQLREVLQDLQNRFAIKGEDYAEWILHSGGRDVLAAVERGLNVNPEKLRWSASVLRDYGNVSSPSVIFALQRALGGNGRDGTWLMAAFGAGISCHGGLLQVGDGTSAGARVVG